MSVFGWKMKKVLCLALSSCYSYELNIATANRAYSFIKHLRVIEIAHHRTYLQCICPQPTLNDQNVIVNGMEGALVG